jgi:platelet-activating factor acetylhydrolase IB subunit alpha
MTIKLSDDKTLRCWDLSLGGKCVKVLTDVHERFITCMRWSPGISKNAPAAYSGATEDQNGESNETLKSKGTAAGTANVKIRCVIAMGAVDRKLKIFAN